MAWSTGPGGSTGRRHLLPRNCSEIFTISVFFAETSQFFSAIFEHQFTPPHLQLPVGVRAFPYTGQRPSECPGMPTPLRSAKKNMEKFGRISFRHFLSTPIHTRPIPLPCHHFRTALCDPGCVSWQPACGCRGPCSPCVGRSAPRGGGELWPNNWLSLTTHSFLRQEVSS